MHDTSFNGNVYFNRETSYFIRNIIAFKGPCQLPCFLPLGTVTETHSMNISKSEFEKYERWKFIIAKSFKNTCDETDFLWSQTKNLQTESSLKKTFNRFCQLFTNSYLKEYLYTTAVYVLHALFCSLIYSIFLNGLKC